jgi:phage tail-like protein
MAGKRIDPYSANSFWLLVEGYDPIGSFQEISGIETETEVRELMQSTKDGKQVIIKTQGASTLKPGKLTVKYAAFNEDPFLKMRQLVVDGKMQEARKNATLTAYNTEDKAVMKFSFKECWVSKLAYSSFSAKGNESMTVTATLEHEGMSIEKV